ncbi:ABC transporter ATP-binding protein [Dictyobacter kobayashii]|uniref:Multidrug ABC transporter ATPase n=1 Tax=Dictyobacter kobayashii TaxID=2014872 RepID=A0A402ASB4_9CHLR|nr:ABC transporter ATP-binding protein [Dictyobacter kobayashii]GCE21987.1 multidrug ABC transporter ATPase [Dictyobacter kobayashii]
MGMSGGSRFGGMGGGMATLWNQQRSLRYLRDGKPDIKHTLGLVWQALRVYSWQLALGTLVMILGVGVGLIPPLLIRTLIDTAIPHHEYRLVFLLGGGLVLFPVGSALLGLGQNYLSIVIAQGMIADLRRRLYRHVQAQGLEFFTWTRAGEIHTRFLNDAGGLQNVLTQSFLGTVANVFTLIGTLVVMACINWQLALITAVVLPAFAFPILHFGQRRYAAMERAQAALGDLSVVLEETLSLSGAIVVKSFGTEEREASRFEAVNTRARQEQVKQLAIGQWLSVVVQGLAALGPALLYTYGAYLVITHQVALGTIVAFAAYMAQLYAPASSLVGANATLLGGLALFDRVFQYLEIPASIPEPDIPCPLPAEPSEGIAFEHVNFRYPGKAQAQEVLHDVSFVAPPGQLTALVGPSGAGKSTLLSLAARFYDPTSGHVLLDGIPLTDVAQRDLRQHLAVVTQELFLFHASLRENICYGVSDALDEAVARVVEAAQLQDLINRLPEGLETIVGERGYRLSGGEKQRVAIARALLCQAPYLLLDEATSSLDSQAERRIQAALEKLVEGRTVIAIAHRLSTIQRADQILVVQQGRIVERGTHASLLQQSGVYQQLYTAQFASTQTSSAEEMPQNDQHVQQTV